MLVEAEGIEDSRMVKSVTVVVKDQPALQDYKDLIPVEEGDPFSLYQISEIIKQVYRTGLFSDVRVMIEDISDVHLTFVLTKKLLLRNIEFENTFDLSPRKMKDSILSLDEGRLFSERDVQKAAEELHNFLANAGYFKAKIHVSTDIDNTASQSNVLFTVISANQYLVDSIVFKGDVVIEETRLKKAMQTRPGKPYAPAVLDEDIEKLKEIYKSLDYQQVKIGLKKEEFDEENSRVSLSISVVPMTRVELVVEGYNFPLNQLSPIWEASVFEEWGLAEGEAKILSYMRQKGFLFAQVDSSFDRNATVLRVYHKVIPGNRYRVGDPEFRGMSYLSVDRIKKDLGLTENFLFLNKTDKARLFDLVAEIESLYRTYGFSDARVDLFFERLDGKVKPVFNIEEESQNRIAKIEFQGNSLFTREDLIQQIRSSPDGPFYQPNVQKDRGLLETYYLNKGIRGTQIVTQAEVIEEGSYVLRFQIQEGNIVTIDKILLTGNDVTRKSTILRELTVKAGELAFFSSILETKRKLEGLGIFSEVHIEEIPLSDGKINLLIDVREGQRNYASLGLGVETEEKAQSFVIWNNAIRLRGTGELIRSNIFGAAHQLSLIGQLSLREQRAVLSWEQPYFFGIPLETYVNTWLESEERKSYGFTRRGFSLTTISPILKNPDMIFLVTLRYARTKLFRLSIPESSVDRQHFPYSTTAISGSLIWDGRDEPFNPERGHFLSSVIEWAYPLFNSESDFQKIFTKYQHYVPLIPKVMLSYTTRLGLGRGVIPIYERFFAGGSNSFRGEEFDELGPTDPDSLQPIGGKALILFTMELSFPLFPGVNDLYGAVFFDKGNVFAKRSLVRWKDLTDAVGFGLRYRTPFGPVRLELGWNLDAPQGEKKPIAFITIGNVF